MKKTLALILCLVMLLGVFPMSAAFAEGETTKSAAASGEADTTVPANPNGFEAPDPGFEDGLPFTDVFFFDYYYAGVYWAYKNGITSGTTPTTFGTADIVNRGDAITFLWIVMGRPEPSSNATNPFTDVKSGKYYYKAVLWAYENGITTGTTETTFSPKGKCERGQIVTFIWKAMGSPAPQADNPFTDVKSGKYYYNPVRWANGRGLFASYKQIAEKEAEFLNKDLTENEFAPHAPCTRAFTMTLLYRAYKYPLLSQQKNKEKYCEFVALKDMPVYQDMKLSSRGTLDPYKPYNSAEIEEGNVCWALQFNETSVKVSYPVGSSRKVGYIKRGDLLGSPVPFETFTAQKKAPSYKSYDQDQFSNNNYGKIYEDQRVYGVEAGGVYVQVIRSTGETTGAAYKLAWVESDDYFYTLKRGTSAPVVDPYTPSSKVIWIESFSELRDSKQRDGKTPDLMWICKAVETNDYECIVMGKTKQYRYLVFYSDDDFVFCVNYMVFYNAVNGASENFYQGQYPVTSNINTKLNQVTSNNPHDYSQNDAEAYQVYWKIKRADVMAFDINWKYYIDLSVVYYSVKADGNNLSVEVTLRGHCYLVFGVDSNNNAQYPKPLELSRSESVIDGAKWADNYAAVCYVPTINYLVYPKNDSITNFTYLKTCKVEGQGNNIPKLDSGNNIKWVFNGAKEMYTTIKTLVESIVGAASGNYALLFKTVFSQISNLNSKLGEKNTKYENRKITVFTYSFPSSTQTTLSGKKSESLVYYTKQTSPLMLVYENDQIVLTFGIAPNTGVTRYPPFAISIAPGQRNY